MDRRQVLKSLGILPLVGFKPYKDNLSIIAETATSLQPFDRYNIMIGSKVRTRKITIESIQLIGIVRLFIDADDYKHSSNKEWPYHIPYREFSFKHWDDLYPNWNKKIIVWIKIIKPDGIYELSHRNNFMLPIDDLEVIG